MRIAYMGTPDFAVPALKALADAGHEIASHGYGHDLIYDLSHDEFREDMRRGIGIVEDLTGAKIRGYRAPSFSITDWAIDILQELGEVAEGVLTARSARALGHRLGIEMPITEQVYALLYEGKPVGEALRDLLARERRAERD